MSINFEGTAAPETNNLRGKLYHGYDGAGIETIPSYDFEGNPNSVIRQYVSDPTQHPDWSPLFESPVSSPAMETETYNTSMTYDALGRPVTITSPDDGITTYAYEESGMLYSIVVNSVHGLSTDIVNEIYYDAKGQRAAVNEDLQAENKQIPNAKHLEESASAKTTEYPTNTTRASVEDKLRRYVLNMDHEIGGSKAKWFKGALGFTQENLSELAKQIVFDESKAIKTELTVNGQKYNQIIPITGANGKTIDVKFAWIRNNDNIVRLVSAIPTINK